MAASQPYSVSENMQSSETADTRVSPQSIRSIIVALLVHCDVPYIVKPYDQFLHDRCLVACEERGYPIGPKNDVDNQFSLLPFLPTGVYIASATYGHLKSDVPRLIYIALYTAFVAYLDDFAKRDIESVALFSRRLVRGEKQGHPVLDCLADLLNDTEARFGRTAANLIVHDTLGFLNSLVLDYETQDLNLSQHAQGFPEYLRLMNALPTAFAMFVFPSDMPISSYIQSVPGIRDFIAYMNDILSFYKEEMRGEKDNYISLLAMSQGLAKKEILQRLADDVAKTTDQIDKILRADSAAFDAWSMFKTGYVYFHTSSPRYKMDGLNLG